MITRTEFRAHDRLIELGDRIHIRKFEGCYEVIHITEKTFFISCGKWRIQGRKSLELPHEEFKCHVGSPTLSIHREVNRFRLEKVDEIKDDLIAFYEWCSCNIYPASEDRTPNEIIEVYKEYLKDI